MLRNAQRIQVALSGSERRTVDVGDRVHDMIQRHIDDAARAKLKVVIDKTFALKEAAAAHAYIESRKAVGRVLLIP